MDEDNNKVLDLFIASVAGPPIVIPLVFFQYTVLCYFFGTGFEFSMAYFDGSLKYFVYALVTSYFFSFFYVVPASLVLIKWRKLNIFSFALVILSLCGLITLLMSNLWDISQSLKFTVYTLLISSWSWYIYSQVKKGKL